MLLEHPRVAGARALIEHDVLERLRPFRQIEPTAEEAGGILLGFRRGPHLHVTSVTTPGAADSRSRYSFVRQDRVHQARATNGWKQSGGYLDYLGEWHTHPETVPTPSALDLMEWRKICITTNEPMIFLIVGQAGHWCGIGEGLLLDRAMALEGEQTCAQSPQ